MLRWFAQEILELFAVYPWPLSISTQSVSQARSSPSSSSTFVVLSYLGEARWQWQRIRILSRWSGQPHVALASAQQVSAFRQWLSQQPSPPLRRLLPHPTLEACGGQSSSEANAAETHNAPSSPQFQLEFALNVDGRKEIKGNSGRKHTILKCSFEKKFGSYRVFWWFQRETKRTAEANFGSDPTHKGTVPDLLLIHPSSRCMVARGTRRPSVEVSPAAIRPLKVFRSF